MTPNRPTAAQRTCTVAQPLRIAAAAVFITLALSILLAVAAPETAAADGENQAMPVPQKGELRYPKLGSHLDQLAVSVEDGEASPAEAAKRGAIHRDESVAVTVHLSCNVADVVQFLEDNGGGPRNVGEDYIEAYVPVTLLGQLSEQSGVIRVLEIIPPTPGGDDMDSDGQSD